MLFLHYFERFAAILPPFHFTPIFRCLPLLFADSAIRISIIFDDSYAYAVFAFDAISLSPFSMPHEDATISRCFTIFRADIHFCDAISFSPFFFFAIFRRLPLMHYFHDFSPLDFLR